MIALVVGYALSPIDLIPDFIPVLGFLDDLILLPLGITLAIKMIPPDVMAKCRVRTQAFPPTPKSQVAAIVIVAIWLGLAAIFGYWVWGMNQA